MMTVIILTQVFNVCSTKRATCWWVWWEFLSHGSLWSSSAAEEEGAAAALESLLRNCCFTKIPISVSRWETDLQDFHPAASLSLFLSPHSHLKVQAPIPLSLSLSLSSSFCSLSKKSPFTSSSEYIKDKFVTRYRFHKKTSAFQKVIGTLGSQFSRHF